MQESGDLDLAGLTAVGHPFLRATVDLAGAGGRVVTGRIGLDTHPWLADHAVAGTVLLPGTAFADMALRAGWELGCDLLHELTISEPLVLSDGEAVRIQVVVRDADRDRFTRGQRSFAARWRGGGCAVEPARDRRAGDFCGVGDRECKGTWPPAGATAVDLSGGYERLADTGVRIRARVARAARGVAPWTGTSTPRSRCARRTYRKRHASRSIQHCWTPRCIRWCLGLLGTQGTGLLPFSFRGVRVPAAGASMLRVRLSSAGAGVVTLTASDAEGRPVAAIESLALRPASPELLRPAGAAARRLLFGVEWQLLDPQPIGAALGAGAV